MAGYTTIDIGGQQVGLRFSIYANELYANQIGKDSGGTPASFLSTVYIYCAYLANNILENRVGDIEFKKFAEWYEDDSATGSSEVARISKIIAESNNVRKPDEDKKKVKKKLIGTKSKHSV